MRTRPEFIIFTPSYSETVGGIIALHVLCQRLNELGYSAALWPSETPTRLQFNWQSLAAKADYYLHRRWRWFWQGPFSSPLAHARDVRSAVVVYPEIVAGNPLGAKKIARWFLHKPGFHSGEVRFGTNEIYFFYDAYFNNADLNPHADHLLRLTYINPAYKQTNFGPRSGSCVLIRKGKDRVLDQHPPGAIVIDDMTHEEKAAVFNQTERLYSYDQHTFYSVYAAICGCVPIIVPEDGVSRKQWHPDASNTLGQAYGVAEFEQAKSEQGALMDQLSKARAEEDRLVHAFVQKCRTFFKRVATA
jgi:hypothetical protein